MAKFHNGILCPTVKNRTIKVVTKDF